jgi:hypothetical protein
MAAAAAAENTVVSNSRCTAAVLIQQQCARMQGMLQLPSKPPETQFHKDRTQADPMYLLISKVLLPGSFKVIVTNARVPCTWRYSALMHCIITH